MPFQCRGVRVPECSIAQVEALLARLRPMEVDWGGQKIPISFSAGCVEYKPGETMTQSLERADRMRFDTTEDTVRSEREVLLDLLEEPLDETDSAQASSLSASNQIRINELARELEIRAQTIINYLPEAGVKESMGHSSSIDVTAAEKVREHFHKLTEAAAEILVQETAASVAPIESTASVTSPPIQTSNDRFLNLNTLRRTLGWISVFGYLALFVVEVTQVRSLRTLARSWWAMIVVAPSLVFVLLPNRSYTDRPPRFKRLFEWVLIAGWLALILNSVLDLPVLLGGAGSAILLAAATSYYLLLPGQKSSTQFARIPTQEGEVFPLNRAKQPLLAAILAFFLGPFGFLYLQLRYAIAVCIGLILFYGALEIFNGPRVETTVWVLPLICLVMALEAGSICRSRNLAFMVDPVSAGKHKWSELRPPLREIIIFLAMLTTFYFCGLTLSFSLSAFREGKLSRGLVWLVGSLLVFFLGALAQGLIASTALRLAKNNAQ
jgi:hypothetical protein